MIFRIRQLKHRAFSILGERSTVAVISVLLLLMMIGTIDVERERFPIRDSLIMLQAAGAFIGFGGIALGITSHRHVQWMGSILVFTGMANALNQVIVTVREATAFWDWLLVSRGVWGWMITVYFGLRLVIFSNRHTGAAIDTIALIRARGGQPEIKIRQREE